jgi:predicted DCC family thiol-disulfide oxidoreductase YuxK
MPAPRLIVWYNTRCPVCDAGIDRQRNKLLAAVRAGTIAFRDINLEPDALASHGASLEDVRRRLHATDEASRLLVGADAGRALAGAPDRQPRHPSAHAVRLRSVRGSLVCLEPAQRALVRARHASVKSCWQRE